MTTNHPSKIKHFSRQTQIPLWGRNLNFKQNESKRRKGSFLRKAFGQNPTGEQ